MLSGNCASCGTLSDNLGHCIRCAVIELESKTSKFLRILLHSVLEFIPLKYRLPLRHVSRSWNNNIKSMPVSILYDVEFLFFNKKPAALPLLKYLVNSSARSEQPPFQLQSPLHLNEPMNPFFTPTASIYHTKEKIDFVSLLVWKIPTQFRNRDEFDTALKHILEHVAGLNVKRIILRARGTDVRSTEDAAKVSKEEGDKWMTSLSTLFQIDHWNVCYTTGPDDNVLHSVAEKVMLRRADRAFCISIGLLLQSTPNLTTLLLDRLPKEATSVLNRFVEPLEAILPYLKSLKNLNTLTIRGMEGFGPPEAEWLQQCLSLKHLCVDGPLYPFPICITRFVSMMKASNFQSFGIGWSELNGNAVEQWVSAIQQCKDVKESFQQIETLFLSFPAYTSKKLTKKIVSYLLVELRGLKRVFVKVSDVYFRNGPIAQRQSLTFGSVFRKLENKGRELGVVVECRSGIE